MDYTSITQFLNSIFTPVPLTAGNIVAVLTEARNKLAILVQKVEEAIAAGTTPPFNINLIEAKKFLRLVDDALELVNDGVIDSTKLLEYMTVPLPPAPSTTGVSPEMAGAIAAAEAARVKLEKENKFLAGAILVLNILLKLIPILTLAL